MCACLSSTNLSRALNLRLSGPDKIQLFLRALIKSSLSSIAQYFCANIEGSVPECTSNLSSLLTTVCSAINVYIYFFKHHNFVLGLVFPKNRSQTVPDVIPIR